MKNVDNGWGMIRNCTKWHYFDNRRSLCGKWTMLFNKVEKTDTGTTDNCQACARLLAAQSRPIPPSVQSQRSTALDAVVSAVAGQLDLKVRG